LVLGEPRGMMCVCVWPLLGCVRGRVDVCRCLCVVLVYDGAATSGECALVRKGENQNSKRTREKRAIAQEWKKYANGWVGVGGS
jgi:hypothetical protein